MLITVTWNAKQGIVFYINGIVSGTSINRIPPVFTLSKPIGFNRIVFGKSVNETEGGFAKFQTTVFSVLKRFVGKSESFRIFTYYVGRAIAKSMEGKITSNIFMKPVS